MDINFPGFNHLPAFLAHTKYVKPHGVANSNWQALKGTSLNFFEWMGANPKVGHDFQQTMVAYGASKPSLDMVYPL